MTDIADRVKRLIVDKLEIAEEEIAPESLFFDDLGADSLSIVELTMALEDEFKLEIPDEEIPKLQTVQHVIDFIQQNAESQQK